MVIFSTRPRGYGMPTQVGESQRVKTQRVKTSENFAEEKMFAEDISEDFSDIAFTGF